MRDGLDNPEQILRLEIVCRRVGYRRSTIYEMIRKGRFPSSIRLGPNRVGWRESEIDAWIRSRPANRLGHRSDS